MNTDFEVSIEQEVADTKMGRPHVVVLGAGASRATCLKGDKNGRALPLMGDFVDIVGFKSIFQQWGINPDQNFEEIFSDLYEKNEKEKLKQIENLVEEYFDKLELPDKPTIYDHLVLSLREKDLIATFNWDPLLINAYLRNSKAGLKLPRLAFLHGNICIGYCEKDKVAGLAGTKCRICKKMYKRAPLLYPIKKKDYAKDLFIANEWEKLKWGFQNAFMITIFGYSGPKTDAEAIVAMKKAWGDKNQRAMEQTAFITTQSEEEISANWEPFIHTHHYEVHADFYESWIANHPRRTGEAYLNQYLEAKFIDNNPIPRTLDFPELWNWYKQFKNPEDKI
jgi:hypothetical protein